MSSNHQNVPFPRRLAALLYDSIAVSTVLYFASFVPVMAAGGQAIAPENPLFLAYLCIVAFGYFGLSWTRGRTLGMQAWKLEIESCAGDAHLTWGQAAIRFAGAALSIGLAGLGFIAALLDVDNRTWHDRLSRSRLVWRKPKPPGEMDSA